MQIIKQSFITIIICLVILTGVNLVHSWTGPPGNPPDSNASAPINVSTTAQTFDGSKILKVGSLGNGSLGINGALTVNGLGIFNSNVGIGTASPGTKLDVNGNISLRSRIFPGALGTENGYSLVHFKGGTDTAGGIVRASKGTDDLGNAPLRFEASSFTFVGNVSANQFCLPGANPTGGCISAWPSGGAGADNDWAFDTGSTISDPIYRTGKVGIGTNILTYNLEVAGSGIQRIRVNSSDNQAGISLMSNSSGEFTMYSPSGTDNLSFYFSGPGNIMTLTSTGNVGIGTTNPAEKLDVSGFIKTSQGIKFPDNTQQTSATIDKIRKNADFTVINWQKRFINWYNICPTNYYLVSCGLSTPSLRGYKATEWAAGAASWSYYIMYNSATVGRDTTANVWIAQEEQKNGGAAIGTCVMSYDCSGGSCDNGTVYSLEADCIKVK